MEVEMIPIPVRVSEEILKRIEQLIKLANKDPLMQADRSKVFRWALDEGLKILERRLKK